MFVRLRNHFFLRLRIDKIGLKAKFEGSLVFKLKYKIKIFKSIGISLQGQSIFWFCI